MTGLDHQYQDEYHCFEEAINRVLVNKPELQATHVAGVIAANFPMVSLGRATGQLVVIIPLSRSNSRTEARR